MFTNKDYDKFFRHSIALLCIVEKTGKILELNSEWERVLGYKIQDLKDKAQYDLLHPDDIQISKQFIDDLANKSEARGIVLRIMHKDGSYRWFEWNGRLVDDLIFAYARDVTELNDAELALQSSQKKIETIFSVIPTGLGSVVDRVITEVNPQISVISGYAREELIGQSSRIFYPDDVEFNKIGAAIQRVFETKQPGEEDVLWQRKDGSLLSVRISGTANDYNDPTKGIIFAAVDITEQEKAKQELLRNQKFLMESQRIAKLGSYEYRLADRNLYWSKETYEIYGLDTELAPSVDEFYKLVHSEDIDRVKEHMTQTLDLQEFIDMECRITTPAGINKTLEFAGEVIKNEHNAVSLIYGVVRDVTEEREREQQIIQEKQRAEESEQRLKALHDASFGGIAVHDKGMIIDCNHGLSEMTGYKVEELIGMNGLLLIAESSRDIVMKNILSDFEEAYEAYGLRKNGEVYPLRIEARVIPYMGQKVRSTEFRDISAERRSADELVKAKEKAEESDQLKTAFLANLSHEIRTPMNGILGFAELLKSDDLTEEMKANYINIIEQSGNRMLRLINDLVDISKIEVNQVELKPEKTNLNALMDSLYDFFKLQVEQKGLMFTYAKGLEENNGIVTLDKLKLEQVLTNLLINAVKFTAQGNIHFSYSLDDECLLFIVKDSGIGIQAGMEKMIFERFRQAENTHLTGIEGTGLGLSISKAFVELMGGKIWVDSIPGEGSTFFIQLPYVPVEEDESFETDIPEPEFQKDLTILVAEDDEVSYQFLEQILVHSNFKILHAEDGVQTLTLLNNHPETSLILMDLKMPVLNGVDATIEIRKINKNIPIIAQTAYAYDTDRKKAMDAGCDDFITKPVKKDILLEKIEYYLAK